VDLVGDHRWPLHERSRHFDVGTILNCWVTEAIQPPNVGWLGFHHAGNWQCDLHDNSLIWSGGVYDIFGIPRESEITRSEALALYCEESRAKMERLRAYAIKHRCGFTLDAEIEPVGGKRRWMRLVAEPVFEGDRAVRLQGLKLII
jgi:PAS domain-containing protein